MPNTKETGLPSATASQFELHGPGSLLGVLGNPLSGKPKGKRMSILDKMFPQLRKKEVSASVVVKEAEDDSLDAAREQIVQQFNDQFPTNNYPQVAASNSLWIVEVYASYVIVCAGADYYRATFSADGGKIEFAPRNEWTAVERKTRWDTVVKELRAKVKAVTIETPRAPLAITKGADGKYRWILFTSSNFEDRDAEIVSKEFHQRDVARMQQSGEYGTVNWWHVGTPTDADPEPELPMLALGDCDFSDLHETADGVMRIESGTFYDDRIGAAMEAHADNLSASLAFSHKATEPKDGVFNSGRSVERSILPRANASNELAAMFTYKESAVEKTKELAQMLGADGETLVSDLLKRADARLKAAKEARMKAKEKQPDPAAEPDMTPEEKAAAAKKKAAKEAGDAEPDADTETKEVSGIAELSQQISDLTEVVGALVIERQAEVNSAKEKGSAENERIAKLEKMLATATKELKVLKGDMPRGLRGYRPSQSDENELDGAEVDAFELLKSKEAGEGLTATPLVDWIVAGHKPLG